MAEPDTQPEPSDPFFQILHDSEWNACVGEQGDEVNYVDGYMEAARELVAAVIDKNLVASRDTLAMPILYNCRHALELALKFAIKRLHRAGMLAALHPVNHDILSHWQHLDQARIGDATLAGILADIKPFVVSLAAIDDDGQELRYAHARDGAKSLGGVPLVNLRLVRRSIALLSDLLDRLKYRIFDIERERATTTHTKECSRADLEEIAKVLGEHSSWSEDSFKEKRQAVMDRFHLGSRKFSEAVNAIRKSRPLAARVGIESNLTYLIDEKAVAALELWSKAHPIQQGAPVSLGMDYFNRDWDAFEKELRLSRELDEAIEGLLSVEELSDLETLFYIGRDNIYAEHYESMLAGKIAEHRVAPRRRERVHHIMSKTNLLDAVVAGAKASGRPSLAMKIRNIRPVA